MALIPWPSRAGPVAQNAWQAAAGGSIFEGAPNAAISAVAIARRTSTPRSITPRRVIRLLRASSRESDGSTTIARKNSSRAPDWPLRSGIRSINQCPDPLDWSHLTGKTCFTNKLTWPTGQGHAAFSTEGRVSDVDRDHQHVQNRTPIGTTRVSASLRRESNPISGHVIRG
jgi:hypothetical protein